MHTFDVYRSRAAGGAEAGQSRRISLLDRHRHGGLRYRARTGRTIGWATTADLRPDHGLAAQHAPSTTGDHGRHGTMRPQDSRAVASASPPVEHSLGQPPLVHERLPLFFRLTGSSWLLQGVLSLGNVSPHLVHSGEKSGVFRAMNACPGSPRQGGCQAVAGVAGQRACTLPARSPSSAAWAAADSSGAGSPQEGARSGHWRLQWRPVAAPRAFPAARHRRWSPAPARSGAEAGSASMRPGTHARRTSRRCARHGWRTRQGVGAG